MSKAPHISILLANPFGQCANRLWWIHKELRTLSWTSTWLMTKPTAKSWFQPLKWPHCRKLVCCPITSSEVAQLALKFSRSIFYSVCVASFTFPRAMSVANRPKSCYLVAFWFSFLCEWKQTTSVKKTWYSIPNIPLFSPPLPTLTQTPLDLYSHLCNSHPASSLPSLWQK